MFSQSETVRRQYQHLVDSKNGRRAAAPAKATSFSRNFTRARILFVCQKVEKNLGTILFVEKLKKLANYVQRKYRGKN